jgi:hypothetical protein
MAKILLIIILTSLIIVIAMLYLNYSSFNAKSLANKNQNTKNRGKN